MAAGYEVDWRGDQVKALVIQAVRGAFDETVSRALEDASILKTNGGRMPYYRGYLTRSLKAKWDEPGEGEHSVRWGSFDIEYAKKQEDKNGFLRGAADLEYPKIPVRIAARFKGAATIPGR